MNRELPLLPPPSWRMLGMVQDPDFDLSYQTDHEGVIRWISPGMAELLGQVPHAVLGRPSLTFIHPDDRAGVLAHRTELQQHARAEDRLVRFLTTAGEYASYLVRVRPVFNAAGSIDAYIVTLSDQLARRAVLRALSTLTSTVPAMLQATTEDAMLQGVCDAIVQTEGYPLAWYGRALPDERRTVDVVAHAGAKGDYLASIQVSWHDSDPTGQGPTGTAIRTGQMQVRNDLSSDPRFAQWLDEASARGIECSLSIPIAVEGAIDGALMAYGDHADAFDDVALRLMELVGADLSSALQRMRAIVRLQTAQQASVRLLATTVETRDPYTAGHQERVADLSQRLGFELGLTEDRLTGLHLGAMVHDLGKIAVPREILNNPKHLTDEDWKYLREHPVSGERIAASYPWPWPIPEIIRQHHERLDGSGYPDGLVGDQIILEARIVGVADVYEAICHERPYREALGPDHAMKVLIEGRGTLFDASVVDAMQGLIEGGFVL